MIMSCCSKTIESFFPYYSFTGNLQLRCYASTLNDSTEAAREGNKQTISVPERRLCMMMEWPQCQCFRGRYPLRDEIQREYHRLPLFHLFQVFPDTNLHVLRLLQPLVDVACGMQDFETAEDTGRRIAKVYHTLLPACHPLKGLQVGRGMHLV